MKILGNFNEIKERVYSNIATPYFRYVESKGMEIGYCVIGERGNITEKYVMNTNISDIEFNSLSILYVPIFVNLTVEGYFRCWIDNPDYFLSIKIREKDKFIELKPYRRKKK